MTKPRARHDHFDVIHGAHNRLAGQQGDIPIGRREPRAMQRIVNGLCDFYVARVIFFQLYSRA